MAVECVFHFDRPGFFAETERLLDQGGTLTLSDFVPSERSLEYLDTIDLSADEGIRWSYGEIDLSYSISRYRELAKAHGLLLSESIDITKNTGQSPEAALLGESSRDRRGYRPPESPEGPAVARSR